MRIILSILVVFLASFSVSSQTGEKKYYVKYRVTNTALGEANNPVLDDLAKQTIESFKDLECTLIFNDSESLFYLNDKLSLEDSFGYRMASIAVGGKRYKNIKSQIKLQQRNSLGETFNILYEFDQYQWEITQEKKRIDKYICFKAVSEYEIEDLQEKTIKKEKIVAWFSPELSFPYGPKGIDGLPGLILEGTLNGKIFFIATEINLLGNNDKEVMELEKPKGGKNIAEKDFQILLKEKMAPIIERANKLKSQ